MVFNLSGCVLQGIPSRAAAPAHQVLRGGGEEGPAHPDRLLRPQGGPQATPGEGETRGTRAQTIFLLVRAVVSNMPFGNV